MNPLNHKKTMANALQCTSEWNTNGYPRQWMNHSFLKEPLSKMQAGGTQARQRFVIPDAALIIILRDPRHHQPSHASMLGNIQQYPMELSWAWRKGGGEMLPWPSRITTLEKGCWLQWRVTVCKLLSPRRLTSVYSNKRFPNCLLPQIHPAMLFRSTKSTW